MALVASMLLLGGCGESDPAPRPAASMPGANLVLWVSNQSFIDESVQLVATVDGATVVDSEFEVKSQHNWVEFPLHLAPGIRELAVTSSTGVRMVKQVTVPSGDDPGLKKTYAVVSYWYDGDDSPRKITIDPTDQPPVFA